MDKSINLFKVTGITINTAFWGFVAWNYNLLGNCETKNIISVDNYFIFQRSYKLCEVLNKINY